MRPLFVVLMPLVLILAGCGASEALDATKSMPGKMKEMLEQARHTNNKVDRQAVLIPFNEMFKAENGRVLSPVPFRLMPYAREFAENASAEELSEFVYLAMKELNEATPDSGITGPPEAADSFNHRQLHLYSALAAVSGFIPEAKVGAIIAAQIHGGGRFSQAVKQMLMLRVRFLRDVLLEASLFSRPFEQVGAIEEAIRYVDQIEAIARLPFAKEISLRITGFVQPVPSIEESLDPREALRLWNKLKQKAGRLTVHQKSLTGNPQQDLEIYREEQVRLERALVLIDSRIQGWTAF